jgi:hypothetical protein
VTVAPWRLKFFGHALESLKDFANPVITGSSTDPATWDPAQRAWNRAD